ncbi:MAG: head-tail connector protein [Pseudomonadota bacterium]
MWLALETPPAAQPVTLDEAKRQLRVFSTAEDAFIGGLIAVATQHLEGRSGMLGRALMTQTWDVRFDCFPRRHRGRIELPMPPLQSVTWIKYLDEAGTEVTLPAERYQVDAQHMIGRVRPAYGETWPVTLNDEGAVRIRFVAGYGDADAVPMPIKQAILLLVGHWWINREAVGDARAQALTVEALTNPYRMPVL